MEPLESINTASENVLKESRELIDSLRRCLKCKPATAAQAVSLLSGIREKVYENLNQLPHEYLIILSVKWLQDHKKFPKAAKLLWNPRQTGDSKEPDLAIFIKNKLIVSAEVTTSKSPKGVIDTRMAKTLEKLSVMEGKKYYFVCTDAMSRRAKLKIEMRKWLIQVINLQECCKA